MEFEWDEAKAAANLRKHGIAFASVRSAFLDIHATYDEDRGLEWRTANAPYRDGERRHPHDQLY